jgi:hypothetical protein
MKKVNKIFFAFVMFFSLTMLVLADNTYTWRCYYQYKVESKGIDLRLLYEAYDIPGETLKETRAMEKQKGYVYYLPEGSNEFKQRTSGRITDFPGRKNIGGVRPYGTYWGATDIVDGFPNASFKNKSVNCPSYYLTNGCGTINTGWQISRSATYTDENMGTCDNLPLTNYKKVCLKNGKTTSCNNMIADEYTTGNLECIYKTDSDYANKSTFKLIYDASTGKVTFNNNGGRLTHEFPNESGLTAAFRSAAARGMCPSRVACNHVMNRTIVVIGAPGDTTYDKSKYSGSGKYNTTDCGDLKSNSGETINNTDEYAEDFIFNGTEIDISDEKLNCKQVMGDNLVKLLHLFITALRIVGAIIAILSGMLSLIPAITSNDAGALKKATTKCIYLAIILVVIGILPTLIGVIGRIAGFDLTCLVK